MSTNPHGILYYGIEFGEELPNDLDYHDANEAWEREHGPVQPDGDNYHRPEWDEWRERNKAWKQTAENVELSWSGCDSFQNHYVHCEPCERKVEWSEQIEIDLATLAPPPGADEWIRAFCERFRLPYKQPTWHLASLYF